MLLMVVATMSFTFMQTLIKTVAADTDSPLHPIEIAFFRNLFGVVSLVPLVLRGGLSAFRTQRIGLHVLRATVQSGGMLSFFVALTLVPLAQVTALSFSAPLFATVLAVLVMGERIRARRITALVVGFTGVLVVLQPGAEALSVGALLVVGSSLAWGTAMTIIKALSRTDSALTITLYAGIFMALITLVPALFVWTSPTLEQLVWLLAIGAVGTFGHLAFAQAFKNAEMSAVLPLDFLRLVWASALGFWLFGEVPSLVAWAGGVLIFGSATYIAVREARLARAKAQAARTT
ncbi:MAG: DMT family transporter [Ectothiorhodospiraceae bacterium]|nr:DMT family transporter [Ectothiorhodospiraceae bacterium]